MTTVTRPRGPLPPRVYWTRRLLVVAVAFALVFGIARLLGSDGSGGPAAQPVGADASTSAPTSSTVQTPRADATRTAASTGQAKGKTARTVTPTPTPTPLAVPSGPCVGSDVVATPTVKGPAYAGRSVGFTLLLTTKVSPACTWDVSAESLVVKVTSGSDRIWSTQDCSAAIPKKAVVVRKDQPVAVPLTWNGQRSDSTCSRSTAWAEPGFYHVTAASFGADPVDQQFELQSPVPRTITATPTPKSKKKSAR